MSSGFADVLHSAFGAPSHLYNIGGCAGDVMPCWSCIISSEECVRRGSLGDERACFASVPSEKLLV